MSEAEMLERKQKLERILRASIGCGGHQFWRANQGQCRWHDRGVF